MPTFMELMELVANQGADVHALRQGFIEQLHRKNGRALILYAANPRPTRTGVRLAMVNDDDIQALMEVLCGVKERALDLIIDSNGGDPLAADAVVNYLREKFDHVRIIVPRRAMSAATMIACGGDEIMMARHGFLGPIDLQIGLDGEMVSAHEVLEQFELVRGTFGDDMKSFWDGPGMEYFPVLLVQCQNALDVGADVAAQHLQAHMFRGRADGEKQANEVAANLADHGKHKAHGRRLSRSYIRSLGLNVTELEGDQEMQDLVLSIFHCGLIAFQFNPALMKLVQNHAGRCWWVIDSNYRSRPTPPDPSAAGEP